MEQHEIVRKPFNKPIRLRKKLLKLCQSGQSIYCKMSHNVVYLFSIYDEMSHNVVYLFSTPNLGNYQADMTISPLALKIFLYYKYFAKHKRNFFINTSRTSVISY